MDAAERKAQLQALSSGLTTVAVTGTNGKTSTTTMIAAIVEAAGELPVRVTTLGMWVGDEQTADDGSMASFVHTLQRARAAGARTVALEVTSRALAAGFAERWPADVGVFTNLTPDHLDRHGTPEAYLAAKAQLFLHLRAGGTAVLNAADSASALLAEVIGERSRVRRFGRATPGGPDGELAAAEVDSGLDATVVHLRPSPLATRLGGSLRLRVAGAFQADNALAAALAADAAGFAPEAIVRGLQRFAGVPGRFEVVTRRPLCIVDFAHTPDALARALDGARALARAGGGRVGCVFGCGGERDRDKRRPMGALADELADAVWLTTDNPRGEDATAIAAMVRAGRQGRAQWSEVPDREAAIAAAVGWARPEDVVLVAGRGGETTQLLGSGPVALSDREAVLWAARRRALATEDA